MKRLLMLLLVVCAPPVAAQPNDATIWISRQMNDGGGRISPDEDVETRLDDGSGFGVSVSRMFTTRISGELAIFRSSSSARLVSGPTARLDLGDLDLTPAMAMARYHFFPGRTLDVYVGGGLAHVLADDLESADLREAGIAPVRIENRTTTAFGAGMLVSLTSRAGLALDARYIPLEVVARVPGDDGRVHVTIDPLLISVGVRVRFGD